MIRSILIYTNMHLMNNNDGSERASKSQILHQADSAKIAGETNSTCDVNPSDLCDEVNHQVLSAHGHGRRSRYCKDLVHRRWRPRLQQ